jgi:branched-chain amino acid transport system permease protein
MIAPAKQGYLGRRKNLIGLATMAVFLGTLPLWLNTPYALSTLVLIGIYTIVTIGLCLLTGYAGQISLGQAAFFGLGAYGSAILTVRFQWSPWVALAASAAATALVAYGIGIPVFRLRGPYLAMGTLAFGEITFIVLNEWKTLTGGPSGLPGIPRLSIGGLILKSDLLYYYLVWCIALLALALALNLVNSRVGRALRAVRDSEAAAESLGVRVTDYKMQALVVSALYASVAGSLYAHYLIFISPTAFDLDVSVRLVLMAAVGGLASVWGAPLGAAAVLLLSLVLRELVSAISPTGSGEAQIVAYGILLVALMIYMPEGLTTAAARMWRRAGGLSWLRHRAGRRGEEIRRGR